MGFIKRGVQRRSNQIRRQGPAFHIGDRDGKVLITIPTEESDESNNNESAIDVDAITFMQEPINNQDITITGESEDCNKPKMRIPISSELNIDESYYTNLDLLPTGQDIVFSGNSDEPEPGSQSTGPQISGPSGPQIGGNSSFWVEKVNDAIASIIDKDRNVHTEDLIDRTVAGWEASNPNWAADVIGQIQTGFRESDSYFYVNEFNYEMIAEVDVLGIPNESMAPELHFEIAYGENAGFLTGVETEHAVSPQLNLTQLNVADTAASSYPVVLRSIW